MSDIGIMLEGQEGLTWERWFRLLDAAESLGLASVHRSDHLTGIEGDRQRDSLSLWPALTAAALRTSRIRFGPMVSPMTFLPPALSAKMAMDLDRLSEGRFDLGIGAGWNEDEHAMLGLDYPRYGQRLELLDEAAGIIRSLWSDDPVDHDGEHLQLVQAQFHPRPPTRTPMLVMGGKGSKTLGVVARHATEWNCSYVGVQTFRAKCAALDEACHRAGRDPGEVARSVMVPVVIGRDDAEVARAIDGQRATFATLPADLDAWIGAGFIGGTPSQVVEQLAAFIEAGASRFMLQHNDLDDLASLELLAEAVLPELR